MLLAFVSGLLSPALGSLFPLKLETKLFYGFDASLEDMETVNDDGRVGECRLDYAVHAVREVHRNFLHGIALVFRKLEQHLHYFV